MLELAIVQQITDAIIHCGDISDKSIEHGFGSDLMSDVLTLENEMPMLITGLSNPQVIRTAEMADINIILIVRGKTVTEDMICLAKENDMILMSTSFSLFKACGILYQNGLKPLF